MTTATLNSGALNEVGFPGAEEGASLIELQGTVQVTCAVSAIKLRLTVGAAGVGQIATSSPVTQSYFRAAAPTTAEAVPAIIDARSKIFVDPEPIVARSTTAATAELLHVTAGATSATATATASARVQVRRSASSTAAAVVAAVALKRAFRSATATGAATAAAQGYVHAFNAGATIAEAPAVVSFIFKRRVGASTQAVSTSTSTTLRKRLVGATAAPTASGTVWPALTSRVSCAPIVGQAVVPDVLALRYTPTPATTVAAAVPSEPVVRFEIQVGANVVAEAIAYSAAADYGLAQPAPEDRRMLVPPSDRLMEVPS